MGFTAFFLIPRDYLTNHLNAGRAAAFYADGSFEQLDHDPAVAKWQKWTACERLLLV